MGATGSRWIAEIGLELSTPRTFAASKTPVRPVKFMFDAWAAGTGAFRAHPEPHPTQVRFELSITSKLAMRQDLYGQVTALAR
jgi:hypothetical protein